MTPPQGLDHGGGPTALARSVFSGTIVTNGEHDRDSAERVLEPGNADLVAFGRPFLADPDLPERLRVGAALNEGDHATFYGGGAGYVDYPALAEASCKPAPAATTRKGPDMSLMPFEKKTTEVLGHTMAYVDVGSGDPIVFLHGNPTSSLLWRNIIPYLEPHGRCIAPDLIGMGGSDKLPDSGPDSYRFVEHRRYLNALLETLGVHERVTFVVHDWGSGLGFDWANRHRDAVAGIAYMEAIVRPVSWAQWPEFAREIFQGFRSSAGEDMVLQRNMFVENVLPGSVLRSLTEEEMAAYRAPFATPGEDRRPTLTWPREVPIEGEPTDVVRIVESYGDWLATSEVPKLFVNADPGAILTGDQREWVRSWPNQEEVTVPGSHFVQEDSPDDIGRALADWYSRLDGTGA